MVVALGLSSCTSGTADPPRTGSSTPTTTTTPTAADPVPPSGSGRPSIAPTGGSRSPDGCAAAPGGAVAVPLAPTGGAQPAELRFAGGVPPAARLCGSFRGPGGTQRGSAAASPGPLTYLFSLTERGKVSTGGGFYWVAGAVDGSVGSVVLSFSETSTTLTVPLVALSHGWQVFAAEYSPGPGYYAPSGADPRGARHASLTVTARDRSGTVVDRRSLDLDADTQQPALTGPTR